jgi:hypothetical protein
MADSDKKASREAKKKAKMGEGEQECCEGEDVKYHKKDLEIF